MPSAPRVDETATKPRRGQGKRTISVEEIAEDLGLSKNTVYQMIKDGGIPSLRAGPRHLVIREVYEAWVAS